MVASAASIEALVCGSRREAAWLERNVLEGAALPPWNRTSGGQPTSSRGRAVSWCTSLCGLGGFSC
jgi:hypothetical protein